MGLTAALLFGAVRPAMAIPAPLSISASETGSFPNHGDGRAHQGDTISYTVTIANSGSSNATGVTFTNSTPTNTTDVAGSLKITPVAADDAYSAVGNTQLIVNAAAGLLANDFDPDDATAVATGHLKVKTGSISRVSGSATGGSLTVNSDGSFTYLPGVGQTGTERFQYTVTDNDNLDSATVGFVDFTVSGRVWYVQNGASNGDGRSTSPFNSLSSTAAAATAGTDIIYVYSDLVGGKLNGNIVLKAGQQLIGQGVALVVNSTTLFLAGTAPTLMNSGGDIVTLSTGNTVKGLVLGNRSGSAITGSSFGTLTASSITITGTGQLLNLTNGTLAATFDSAGTNSAIAGISLTTVQGSLVINSGNLTGISGNDFVVNGGTVSITYAGTISNISGNSVNIQNHSSGAIVFSGAISDTGSGIFLNSNGTSTIDFTGGLSLSTGTNAAFTATGGGTVTVTGTNTLATTTATALNVANTNIGANGLNFRSISAGTGAGSSGDGIILDTTGSAGGLTVSGTGAVGSGGTIQHKTGADGNTANGIGIYLNSTSHVSLSWMQLNDFDNFAIYGTSVGASGVNGLSLSNCIVNGVNGNNGATPYNEASIYLAELLGNNTMTNVTVSGGRSDNLHVENTGGTLNTLTVTNCTIQNNSNSNDGNTGFDVLARTSANMTVSVQNCLFQGNRSDTFHADGADSSNLNVTFSSNTILSGTGLVSGSAANQGNIGVDISASASAQLTFLVDSNLIGVQDAAMTIKRPLLNTGINIFNGTTSTANVSGKVSNNKVQNDDSFPSGTSNGYGIRVFNSNLATMQVNVTGNKVRGINTDYGILAESSGATSAPSAGDAELKVAITNNDVAVQAGALDGIRAQARNFNTLSARINGNTAVGGGSGFVGLFIRQANSAVFNLEGLTSGLQTNSSTITSYLNTQNAGTSGSVGASFVTGITGVSSISGIPALLFAKGGVEAALPSAQIAQPAAKSVLNVRSIQSRVPANSAARSGDSPTGSLAKSGQLTQAELNQVVQAAISRWESTDLTIAQRALLRSLKFEVTSLPASRLGEADGKEIRLDNNAGGNGWFIDSGAQSDKNYAKTASATRRYTDPAGAPAGRMDLLTAIMHEMGHALGLEDTYLEKDRDSLMYGYLTKGERRLPAMGQAKGVEPDSHPTMHFLTGPVSIGTLPPGKTVIITYQVLINNPVSVGATQISSQGTVSGSNFTSIQTDDPSVGGASDPTITLLGIPPVITSGTSTTFQVGTAGSFNVAATGVPAPTFSVTGTLPAGVSLSSAGVLSGTSAAGTGGVYPVTITGSNGVLPNSVQNFTLTVNEAPTITSTNSATFKVGTPGLFTVTTGHVFPAGTTLSVTGTLPNGVIFTDKGDGTATLSGTPGVGTGGSYSLIFTGTNGISPNATQNFTLKVNEPPAITSANNATFKVGVSGTFSVTTGHDFPTATALTETGSLPSGVTFTDNGNGTATLAGSPNAGTGGVYPITITGSNGVSPNAAQSFTLTVNEAPVINSANNTTFKVGTSGSFTVTTGNHFPSATTLTISGSLPSGVGFTDNGDGTATLSGTPGTGTGGTYSVSFTAANGITPNGTQNFTLTVNEAPTITSADNATFTIGAAGNFTVTTKGFPVSALSGTGTLPGGISFVDNGDGTAKLSGTAALGTNGIYHLSFTANNGTTPNATQSFTLTVKVPVSHFTVTGNPGSITAGTAFNVTVTALDDTNSTVAAYTGSVHFTSSDVQAVLPANSTLTNGVGTFSVTLKTSGSQTVSVNDTSSVSVTGTSSNTTVNPASSTHFAVSAPTNATAGTAFNYTVTALDSYDNTTPAYTGTAHFTSSDAQAVLAANSTLTNGVGTFSATLKTSGTQTLAATDTVTPSITGTSNNITVASSAITHFAVSAPSTATAGTAFNYAVTAQDTFNNTVTTYSGTAHFTCSDVKAVLPANSTLTNGAGTLSATLKTSGTQTLTVTDSVLGSITGTSNQITVNSAAATHFAVSAPSGSTAGTAFNFTVTAQDAFDNTATAYAGTIHLTSSDGQSVLPSDTTLTNGVSSLSATLKTAGNQTLTATDTVAGSITGTSGSVLVDSAAATHIVVSAPSSSTAGNAFNFTVTAQDAFNNTAAHYTGTLGFTSSDAQSVLPTNNTLTNGAGTFSATLKTAGNQTLTATDSVIGSINGTSNTVTVGSAAATHFAMSAPTSATAGSAFNFTVTAQDPFENTATGYSGTIHLTSSDGQSVLPANSTLTNGAGTFSATLKTAGTQTLTATDTVAGSITGTSNNVTVGAAAATHLAVSAPASTTAGSAFDITLTALDQFNNTATDYAGTVHLTSSDSLAVLPSDTTLTSGVATLSATLKTAANQTISATDTVEASISGISNSIAVAAAEASHFKVQAPASATAGVAFNFTVTAQDAFENTSTNYAGSAHFTSSDGQSVLPADSTLTNGSGTFSATLKTSGTQTIIAHDSSNSAVSGTSNAIAVAPGDVTHLAVSAPSTATADIAFAFTVTARDAFNNTVTGYGGTVHFTSTDGSGTLPADSSLTNGAGGFSATLRTPGTQTITATDTVNSSIAGTTAGISVVALPPVAVDDLAFTTAKVAIDIDVLANDSDPANETIHVSAVTQGKYGAVTINAGGTVHYAPSTTILGTKSQPDDSFTYTITNLNGKTATATVKVSDWFIEPAGDYDGLLQNAAPANGNQGYVNITLNKRGMFTGKLRVGGVAYNLNGNFDTAGHYSSTIARGNQPALILSLNLDAADDQIGGTVSDGGSFTSTLELARKTASGGLAGNYTVILPANPINTGTAFPQGMGFARMTVDSDGLVKLNGKLGDGTNFTSSTFLHSDQRFAVYAGLYANSFPQAGSISGMLKFENLSNSDADGTLLWFKPAHAGDKLYPAGFTSSTDAVVSRYVHPATGNNVFGIPAVQDNALVTLGDDSVLPAFLTKAVTLNASSHVQVTSPGADHLNLTITANNGLFQGSFVHPISGKITNFNGVIFQKQNKGFGVFVGVDHSGSVELEAK